MNRLNFQALINSLTKRDFIINSNDTELQPEKEYHIYRKLPITERTVSFYWKTPKKPESFLRSFITAYASKYREPNPARYRGQHGGESWEQKSPKQREYAYSNHASNMFSKKQLIEQIEANANTPGMDKVFSKYGFYATEYGIGIFVFYGGEYVIKACKSMTEFLQGRNIPFSNELSDAHWVLRYKINAGKNIHESLLKSYSAEPETKPALTLF